MSGSEFLAVYELKHLVTICISYQI